jgi:uncharacterized glyoxalase superfamily protein PhnB
MLGLTAAPSPHGPLETPKSAGARGSSLYVDAHCEHSRASGAKVLDEPLNTFWADRIYTVLDDEHHFWTFATHLKDVDFANLSPPE